MTDLDRAEHLLDLRRHDEAANLARQALAEDPGSGQALHVLGRAFHGMGDHVEAEQVLRAALASRPAHAGTALSLSEVLAAQNRPGEAASIAREVVAHEPHWWVAHYQLSAALLRGPRAMRRESLPVARQVVEMAPNNAAAHNILGLSLERNGKRRAARAAYAKALELDPNHANSLNNLASMNMSLFSLGRGSDQLRRALALDPSDPIFQRNLSLLMVRMCGRLFLALLVCGALIAGLVAAQAPPILRALGGALLIALVGLIARSSIRSLPAGVRRPLALIRQVRAGSTMILLVLLVAAGCVCVMAFAPAGTALAAGGVLLILIRVLAISVVVGWIISLISSRSKNRVGY
ncbi:Flp pilus assembly protein TadD [Nocardioides daedukensis]|uniref:Flp pilus assembly protein TadD n=1 Tax=Nocardioides daedukensis TaxID=634462 RepID=A0A7Y9UR05_9ACTN|nr:Flp pilus assembly protein TadD [Nocardioides daedukensis]